MLQIVSDVTLIEDADTFIYVVEGENSAIVIDTGYGFYNLKEAVEEITKKPLTVICTHGHIDHAFGGHYFEKIYMHIEELPVYEKYSKYKIEFMDKFGKEFNLTPEELEKWYKGTANKIEFISQGQTFDIGGNILEVISLRGHTPGSIGLLDRKHRILFSGDAISTQLWMQLPESTTIAQYLETVKAIKPYCEDFDTIYMGHRRNKKPVFFIAEVEGVLNDILAGCTGKQFNNEIAMGMICGRSGCEVVYNPERIW